MKTFIVRETIVREYEVEAEDRGQAYERVMNDGDLEFSEESEGVSDIIEIDTSKQLIL